MQDQKTDEAIKKPIKEMSADELRDYNAAAQQKTRDEKKSRIESKNQQPRSKHEVSKKDAREILQERGIQNGHVIDVLIDLTESAARQHKIPFNDFLLRRGLHSTLAALQGRDFEDPEGGEETGEIPGELISRKELHALWDVSSASMTFEEFLAKRHRCKTDCFYLGKEILGKDFHEVHQNWANFFPKFNPDTLRPDYSQEDMKAWLDQQSEKKDFLLLASRNCYKSSFSHVWLVSAILNCPDLRCLLISETQPLAKGFIKAVRGYFEIGGQPTLFQQLFAEYCIPIGEGSVLTFQCPVARLNLIQQTAQSTSADSSTAGQRCDILLCDDEISNLTTGNEEQRNSSIEKFDLAKKLLEVGGLTLILGTPWHPNDLYATLLKRNEEDEDKPLQFRIDPAWTVKPEAKHKDLKDLHEEDVILLFPSRLTWKFLQKERRANERFFRSQNLVEFVPDDEDQIKVNFDHDVLVRNIASLSSIPEGENVICVDVAYSQSRYADNSAISVVRLYSNPQLEKCMAVLTVDAARMRMSELAHRIVMLTRQYSPRTVVIEKSQTWDLIASEIQRTGLKYSTHVPIFWLPPSNRRGAKTTRLKGLEIILNQGRLKFVSGAYIDDLFNELEKLDGSKSSSSRKDDRADSLGICQKLFLPASGNPDSNEVEESRSLVAAQRSRAMRDANYARIFGTGGQSVTTSTPEESPRNYFPHLSRPR